MTSVDVRIPVTHARRRRSTPRVELHAVPDEPSPERARRAVNLMVAIVGLLVTTPVMLIVALAIRLSSRGPILYSQTRIGIDRRGPRPGRTDSRRQSDLGGRPFTIYKFRTMVPQRDRNAEVWASPDDPRVTALGRVLRKYRLDELPQLWNVLRGDMNVVGPRPEQPSIFVQLRQQVDGYRGRQRVRPGITGWAQINHHYDRSVDDVRRKLALDLEYIARQSLMQDLKIMALTLPVVVLRKGAW